MHTCKKEALVTKKWGHPGESPHMKPRREKRQENAFLGYLESTLSLELKAHYCTCQMTSGSKQNGALVLCSQ